MSNYAFGMIRELLETHLFGSIALFALFLITIMVIMILAARVSFRIALIIMAPAFLALFGVGISQAGLLGAGGKWIAIMFVISLAVGGLAVLWNRMSEG